MEQILPISADSTIKVTWNGTEYECVALDASAMVAGAVIIGNFPPLTGVDTGEPFTIGIIPGQETIIMAAEAGEVSVKIESIVAHTIDPKFLPAGAGGGIEIVTAIERSTYAAPAP
jgi:hypothetical protein